MKPQKYIISYDSTLGEKIKKHFEEHDRCNKALLDFIVGIEKHQFVHCDENTSYKSPDDTEAGGLIALTIPKQNPELLKINKVIWNSVIKDDEDFIYFFPRIKRESHWIRYEKALRLMRQPNWEFKCEDELPDNPKVWLYKDIKANCPTKDKKELTPSGQTEPRDNIKVCLGRRYFFDKEDKDIAPKETSKLFAEAVDLLREWNELPIIPFGTLPRILKLEIIDKKTIPLLDYQRYEDHIEITTNLKIGAL